ncbi:glycosyltransferase [Mesorhizobium sp. M1423]|uniref:glycosyltransferase family 4 protein n=1 Tax=Mesorhizobium sp. M1423 TaxID=2957101 RepID=UPI0033380383
MGAKTVWWGHYWSATSRKWSSWLRLLVMRFADVVLFYTDKEVEVHRATARHNDRQVVFGLNNGIETVAIEKFRIPYNVDQRPRDLLFIGRITEKSEIDLLLNALTYPQCASVTLDVIGAGGEKDALQRRLADRHLDGRVVLHGGLTDEARISEIANQCKLFVYPGGVGLSLIHALAYGLPGVVHDDRKTHMPEIAAHEEGVNGCLFRKGNAESLADTIATALESPEELNRMSGAALNTVGDSFNTADMARRFLKMFRDIAASRR